MLSETDASLEHVFIVFKRTDIYSAFYLRELLNQRLTAFSRLESCQNNMKIARFVSDVNGLLIKDIHNKVDLYIQNWTEKYCTANYELENLNCEQ